MCNYWNISVADGDRLLVAKEKWGKQTQIKVSSMDDELKLYLCGFQIDCFISLLLFGCLDAAQKKFELERPVTPINVRVLVDFSRTPNSLNWS